jgi:predicted lipid-binding transport protein (Tim44 family)
MARCRSLLMLVALLGALAFAAADANARAGGGSSFGSRGMRTFSPPAPTQTAPNTAAPIERSMTPRSAPATVPTAGGWFSRPGLLGGLAAGFLGAGLFGLLFGHGLFGGLGGFASIFGLLLQLAVVFFVARLIWGWYQRRHAPAYAGGGASMLRGMMPGAGAGDGPGHGIPGGAAPIGGGSGSVAIAQADYDAFERLLGEVQSAYGAEDLGALRRHVTPEMLAYFAEELAANASRGVINRISDVKLLQGDLAEAWRERDGEYATVAMRFSLIDQMADRASGRIVEGDPARPTEATELWTFRRAPGSPWLLAAIQQAR